MKIIADTHTHTLACTHAYSTVLENAKQAADIGLKYLAITDHAPAVPDAPHIWHFYNISTIPKVLFGVNILRGVEVNILNANGDIDLDFKNDRQLRSIEWVVASIHSPCCEKMTVEQATTAYTNVAKSGYVDVIGHSGNPDYAYDYDKAVKVFKECRTLVEINQHSFLARKSALKNCVEIARACKKYDCNIVVNSDAHFAYDIGIVDDAFAMLEEIDFPQKLIVNSSEELFGNYLNSRKQQ